VVKGARTKTRRSLESFLSALVKETGPGKTNYVSWNGTIKHTGECTKLSRDSLHEKRSFARSQVTKLG